MANFHLKVITPEEIVFDGEASLINVDTDKGQLGILPNHVDFVTKINPGLLRIVNGSKETVMATGEGVLQMNQNKLVILTDLAEDSSKINEKEAEEAKKRAQDALSDKLSGEEYSEVVAVLERSLAKLRVKRRHH